MTVDYVKAVRDLYSPRRVRDPTLSKGIKEGVYVDRPVLRLLPTRIDGALSNRRRAEILIGPSEAAAAELSGAVIRLLEGIRAGRVPTYGNLRTAADAALIRDGIDMQCRQFWGEPVEHSSHDDDLGVAALRGRLGVRRRERLDRAPWHPELSLNLHKKCWATNIATTFVEPTMESCSACGPDSRRCPDHQAALRSWRSDYEVNLRTYKKLLLTGGRGEDDTPPHLEEIRGAKRRVDGWSDPTGDAAAIRADIGDISSLVLDELLTPPQAMVVRYLAAGYIPSDIARAMGVSRATVGTHRDRAREKFTPRRRRLTWRQEVGRSVRLVGVRPTRVSANSLLGPDFASALAMPRRRDEVVCPSCHLILLRGVMRGSVCATCAATFSDSLSTNDRLVPLSKESPTVSTRDVVWSSGGQS